MSAARRDRRPAGDARGRTRVVLADVARDRGDPADHGRADPAEPGRRRAAARPDPGPAGARRCGWPRWSRSGWAALPLLFAVAPAVGRARPFGVALPWLLLGVAAYPFLFAVGAAYVRLAERTEAEFTDLVERPDR